MPTGRRATVADLPPAIMTTKVVYVGNLPGDVLEKVRASHSNTHGFFVLAEGCGRCRQPHGCRCLPSHARPLVRPGHAHLERTGC